MSPTQILAEVAEKSGTNSHPKGQAMKALVLWATSRGTTNDAGAVVVYSNVAFQSLTAKNDEKNEAGYRPVEVRANQGVAEQLREAIRSQGPLVCDLELIPQIFGKQQSLQLVAATAIAKLDQINYGPQAITVKKAAV